MSRLTRSERFARIADTEVRRRRLDGRLALVPMVVLLLSFATPTGPTPERFSPVSSVVPMAAPTTPPAAVCGSVTPGPSTPPPGAITVSPAVDGDLYTKTNANPAGSTFWLAPGTHTLGTTAFGQVIPKNGDIYLGAPGAILDGKGVNRYAFSQAGANVTIRYLTVQGFVAPLNEGVINHDSGDGWVIEYNTVQNNSGAGMMAGKRQVVRGNCLKNNGQYAMNAYQTGGGLVGLVVEGNEIVGNNTGNWETVRPGCGCTGGIKFWAVNGADVRSNWVHGNHGPGLWADNNNNDFLFENNLIESNDGQGVFYEQGYNATIRNNTFRSNAWLFGRTFANRGDHFPNGAIYVSESGGEPLVPARTAKLEITGNVFQNNWDGIVAWENADRFCNSPANTGTDCTLVLGANQTSRCVQPGIATEPLYSACRWKTKNLDIHDNSFSFTPAAVDGGCPTGFCGRMALFSNFGTFPAWSPYMGTVIEDAITLNQNNHWHDNTYAGPWSYIAHDVAQTLTAAQWKAAPYNQDGAAMNLLDADTSTLEGGMGKWTRWYSADLISNTEKAHTGASALRASVTANYGWGLQLSNYPGFMASTGPQRLSYWVIAGTPGTVGTTVTLTVRFRNSAGGDLLVASMPSPALSNSWQQVTATATAPAGTAKVFLQITGIQPVGQTTYFDDFFVGPVT